MLYVVINRRINFWGVFNVILSKRSISEYAWKENKLNKLKQYVRLSTDYRVMLGPYAETLVKDLNLAGKTCLLTGASGGIGSEITRCLTMRDCKVLMACRNVYKAEKVAKNVCANIDLVTPYELNLGSLASVKRCADNILKEQKHLKLHSTQPLLEDVSLPEDKYTSIKSYNISKFCGVLLMHYLSCQWKGSCRAIFCAHPGSFIKTGLCQNWWPYEALYTIMLPFSKSIRQGASTIIYCATSPELEQTRAAYYKNCKSCEESDLAKDLGLAFKFHNLISNILHERVCSFDKLVIGECGLCR